LRGGADPVGPRRLSGVWVGRRAIRGFGGNHMRSFARRAPHGDGFGRGSVPAAGFTAVNGLRFACTFARPEPITARSSSTGLIRNQWGREEGRRESSRRGSSQRERQQTRETANPATAGSRARAFPLARTRAQHPRRSQDRQRRFVSATQTTSDGRSLNNLRKAELPAVAGWSGSEAPQTVRPETSGLSPLGPRQKRKERREGRATACEGPYG
jgi:hypothetical protein